MSNQLQITGGAKVRNLNGVITGTTGVLGSVPLGAANGVATLDSGGKVPVSQLPSSVVTYLGTWNAATNTPTLVNGTGDAGDLYICNVAGTVNFGAGPISFVVGDWVLYGSGTWQKSSGQNGTVTSVAVTETGDALTITGSPITTAGTINIGFAGTSAQYVAGNGTLITFPSLTGYVPYTGATANVDLGEYELKAGQLTLDVSPTGTASVGTTKWNNTIGSSETTLKGGSVILKNGVDLVARVVNKVTPNTTLTKAAYSAVRVSGAAGQRLAVAYAQANNDNNSADTIGLVTETIATNQEGFIITVGQLLEINTTGSLQGETWVDGDVLYLSPTTPGALTNVKPNGLTGHIVVMGYVEYAHAVHGSIYVKVMNGWELDELHNVYITSPTNNQGLFYNSSNSLWENKSIATALGYTPADDSLVVKLAGTQTITGTKTFNSTTTTSKIRVDNTLLSEGTTVAFKQYESGALGETGYTSLAAQGSNLFYINWGGTKAAIFDSVNLSTFRTYTLPNADGTLALTSDIPSLTGYVTLATTQTITGAKTFNNNLYIDTNAYWTKMNPIAAIIGKMNLYAPLGLSSSFVFLDGDSGKSARFNFDNTANRTYTFPSATGTIALTSDIPSLSGYVQGTGTTNYLPKFTGASTIGNSSIVDDGTIITTKTNSFQISQLTGVGPSFIMSATDTEAQITSYSVSYGNGLLNLFGGGISFWTGTVGGLSTSQAMTINPSGNVSIGNSNDTYKLDVSGTGRFTGALTGTSAAFSSSVKVNGASGALSFDVLSTSQYDGIRVYNTSSSQGADIRVGNDANNNLGFLRVGGSALGNANANTLMVGTGGGYDIHIAPNGTPAITVKNGGNVGIGTSSPSANLQITGSGDAGIIINSTAGAYTGYLNINAAGGGSAVIRAIGGTPFLFEVGGSERMRITSGGFLKVSNTGTYTYLVNSSNEFQSNVSDAHTLGVVNSSASPYGQQIIFNGASPNNTTNFFFFASDSTNSKFIVWSNGNVVNRNNSYGSISDSKLKKNIEDATPKLNDLLKVKIRNYNLIGDDKKQIGVIAQELEEIFPNMIEESPDRDINNNDLGTTTKNVKYSVFVPMLIKAIQEQQEQIEQLKLEIDELKNK